ncbi:hypothetical protein FOB64_000675 [Candida albicans]|uniref:Eisosome protein 1 n=1 Tax=Candida albicans TaxID=5476 RepID=A0A8H6C5F9_CANAX|nr:hypothetical protein FOB64_000675 [Candida albicans]
MSHSAYKASGKPLSAEALYHQRVKQGVFQSPSGTIVGVNSNASDTAALLAASSDLSVQPSYVRSVAPEAHTAALAAKQQEIKAWERGQEDPDASAAASNAKRTNTLSSTTPSTTVKVGIPSMNSNTIYKAASANSTSTMTSRINPEKDIRRSGIQSKQGATSLNIDKINKLATKNSTKSLSSRFNPDLDYRSGLKKQAPAEFLNQDEEDLAASGAAASLKHGAGFTDQVSSQKRSQTFTAASVVNASLLKAANEKAELRLNSLKSNNPATLKAQAQLYANALALAQKRSDERSQSRAAGLINLGGGLTISQSELDKLASTYVQPILDDIEELELQQLHEKAKKEEHEAKEKEKPEDEKYAEYQAGRNEEVQTKLQEYKDVEAKHAEEKQVLLDEKKENQDRIDTEEAEKIAARKQELEELQAEKDEILKPTLDELKEESAKLEEVTNARDELANEVKASEDLNKEYEEKLAELESKLQEAKNDIEKYTTDIEEATAKHESTDKEVAELQELHDKEKADAEKEHEDLDEDKATKKKDILAAIDEKVKDEHKINSELPEHLREEVDEGKIRDTSSIFSGEEPEIKHVPLIKESETTEPEKKTAKAAEDSTATKAADTTASTASKPVATAATDSTSKRPVTPSAAQSPTKKKSSFSRRLSSIFKYTNTEEKPKSTTTPSSAVKKETKPAKKAAETTKAPATKQEQPAAKDAEKEAKSVKDGDVSEFADFEDEVSLNRKENKGGVFTEEI